jgi:hypothetical protein
MVWVAEWNVALVDGPKSWNLEDGLRLGGPIPMILLSGESIMTDIKKGV